MAHTVQSVTLALTLPISCHICLGKVRQPVICVNNHVFCSICIALWLKNNNQCPVCRVAITPENPCKDIIGGASENEDTLSHSVRKHLRKTRFELLHKEYEDEIESLINETEELRRTNLQLEERLSRVTDPVAMSACNCDNKQMQDKDSFRDKLLEDWNERLEMLNAANKKVTQDMEKLKEENRRLKNENIECARENLRLKNEVELRSPQKFGRFTVATLQAKIEQYEREMSRLGKALERSDQYIEELEEQIVQLKKPESGDKQMEESQCGTTDNMEEYASRPSTSNICKNNNAVLHPKDSQEDGVNSKDPTCRYSTTRKTFVTISKLENSLASASWAAKEYIFLNEDSPRKGIVTASQDFASPSSSLPFSSLQLKTPDSKASCSSHAHLKKPLTYLRKLTFDDLPKKQELGQFTQSRTAQTQPTNKSKCDEDLDQPEPSNKNSALHNDIGHGSLYHLPANDFIAQPACDFGITGFQDNCTNSNANVNSESEVKPQPTTFAFPEYRHSSPAKRKLLKSFSNSPSKSSKH